jgi:hypothetical protein
MRVSFFPAELQHVLNSESLRVTCQNPCEARPADFSFDRYLLFAPVSTHLGRRCATQALTASSRKS